ncbi:twin-arginine translocase TatA/TatE family subunit [Desulfovibrio sp.]|uniref:twin-arginine translocase TatA/TatE family subunit n=1 Tax=Desulfovibrio sp. TaxID=885 RepID=UPI0030778EB3
MFGIGSTEFLVILLVALVVLGPKSLASVSRTLGKAMGEFRRVSTDFQRTLNAEVEQEEHLKRKQEAEKEFFSPEARAEHAAKTAAQTQATAQPQAAPAAAPAATETAARPAVQPEVIPSAAPVPPADSPLAQALAKAQTEAGSAATPASGAKA